jgi:multiple sugar transport system substrate-binding protein
MALASVGCQPGDRTATDEPDPTVTTDQVTRTPSPTKTSQPQVTNTIQVPEGLQIDPDALADVSIVFAHPFAGDAEDTIREIARSFSLTNPWGIWVDAAVYGSEEAMIEAINADALESDPPELVAMHPYEQFLLEEEIIFVDLMPYFNDPSWGFSTEAQEDIPALYFEPFLFEETLTGLPFAPQATVLFYNQSWAEALGFSQLLRNEADLVEQSEAATFANLEDVDEANDGMGGYLIRYQPEELASWYLVFNGELPTHETPSFNNPSMNFAFIYLKSVYDEGFFWIGNQPEPYPYFARRQTLAYAGRLDEISDQLGWMDTLGNTDEWTVMGIPGNEKFSVLVDSPGLMVVESSPESQLAAWLFASHLIAPEIQAELVQSLFTLPVRESATESLGEFFTMYPQYREALDLVDTAVAAPASTGWGISRWLLQDVTNRLIFSELDDIPLLLQQLDEMISEFEGMVP